MFSVIAAEFEKVFSHLALWFYSPKSFYKAFPIKSSLPNNLQRLIQNPVKQTSKTELLAKIVDSRSGVFVADFEKISHLYLLFLLLTFNK